MANRLPSSGRRYRPEDERFLFGLQPARSDAAWPTLVEISVRFQQTQRMKFRKYLEIKYSFAKLSPLKGVRNSGIKAALGQSNHLSTDTNTAFI